MCFSRRKASLSNSPNSSPVSSPKMSHQGSCSSATPSQSPSSTPPSSPGIVTATPWKSRLHTIKNSFLGSPRFHRRKMQGTGCGYYPPAAFAHAPEFIYEPDVATGELFVAKADGQRLCSCCPGVFIPARAAICAWLEWSINLMSLLCLAGVLVSVHSPCLKDCLSCPPNFTINWDGGLSLFSHRLDV